MKAGAVRSVPPIFCGPSLADYPQNARLVEVAAAQQEAFFASLGLRYMPISDWGACCGFLPTLLPQNELRGAEAELVTSGEHPLCGLFTQEHTGVPTVRLRGPVTRGTLLGQYAAIVKPNFMCEALPHTIEGAARACCAFVVPVRQLRPLHTDLPPADGDETSQKRAKVSTEPPSNGAAHSSAARGAGATGDSADAAVALPVPPAPRAPSVVVLAVRDWPDEPMLCRVHECQHRELYKTAEFSNETEWFTHLSRVVMRVVAGASGFACPWSDCTSEFTTRNGLVRHLHNLHGRLYYRCSGCGTTFNYNRDREAKQHCSSCLVQAPHDGRPAYAPPAHLNGVHHHHHHHHGANGSIASLLRHGAPGAAAAAADGVRGPELLLRFDAGQCTNLFGLMRSSFLQNMAANVQVVLCFAGGRPVLAVEALEDLPYNTELLFNWGEANLARLLRVTLWAQASASHAIHIYRRRLEQLYSIYRLAHPALEPLVPVDRDPDVLWLHYLRGNSISLWEQQRALGNRERFSVDTLLPVVSLGTAFGESECQPILRTEASADARALIMTIPLDARPPRWKDIFEGKLKLAEQLLYTSECPNIELCRVDFLHHPVRFLNPPTKPQYAVFAKTGIVAGSPVVCYKGVVVTEQEYDELHAPQYTFDFDLGLHVNADDKGNEGRFVNDCFGRNWGDKDSDQSAANAHYLCCWDDTYNVPVLFIVAGGRDGGHRNISKGDEIVVDYGEAYWSPLMLELGRRHTAYFSGASQVVRRLEQGLRAHGIAVPPRLSWAELLEQRDGNIFEPLAKSALQYEEKESARSEEVEIERIVEKRVKAFGVQYLVKWRGYDWSHNQWVHANQIAQSVVAAFESQKTRASRRRK